MCPSKGGKQVQRRGPENRPLRHGPYRAGSFFGRMNAPEDAPRGREGCGRTGTNEIGCASVFPKTSRPEGET